MTSDWTTDDMIRAMELSRVMDEREKLESEQLERAMELSRVMDEREKLERAIQDSEQLGRAMEASLEEEAKRDLEERSVLSVLMQVEILQEIRRCANEANGSNNVRGFTNERDVILDDPIKISNNSSTEAVSPCLYPVDVTTLYRTK